MSAVPAPHIAPARSRTDSSSSLEFSHSSESPPRSRLPVFHWKVGQDHPPDHKVEEEDGVDHQGPAVGRLAVGQEGRGCKGGPAERRRHNHQPHHEADRSGGGEQDDPAHHHGHGQRQDAVSQHAQALEEGERPAQQLGVQRDDDGAEPDDDEDLQANVRGEEESAHINQQGAL